MTTGYLGYLKEVRKFKKKEKENADRRNKVFQTEGQVFQKDNKPDHKVSSRPVKIK